MFMQFVWGAVVLGVVIVIGVPLLGTLLRQVLPTKLAQKLPPERAQMSFGQIITQVLIVGTLAGVGLWILSAFGVTRKA